MFEGITPFYCNTQNSSETWSNLATMFVVELFRHKSPSPFSLQEQTSLNICMMPNALCDELALVGAPIRDGYFVLHILQGSIANLKKFPPL